jgi:hypothetical protein
MLYTLPIRIFYSTHIEKLGEDYKFRNSSCVLSIICLPFSLSQFRIFHSVVSKNALRRADPPAKESYQMSLYVDREAH